MAATFALIGSLVLIFSLADMLGQLRTPETREQVAEMLAEPPASGLGLEVAQVVDLMRVLVYVAAALAAAIFVLAIYVLQRHRGARIGLTVAAALLLFTTPVAGLMPMLVALAAALLWSTPARDWFAGRPVTQPAARSVGAPPNRPERPPERAWPAPEEPGLREDHGSGPEIPPVVPPAAAPTSTDAPPAGHDEPPPASRPFAAGDSDSWPQPSSDVPSDAAWAESDRSEQQVPAPHPGWAAPAVYAAPGRSRRPWTVTLAAILTWLGSAAVSTAMLAFLAVLAFDSDTFVDEFDRAAAGSGVDLSRDQVMAAGWAIGAMFMLWALTAAVLAVLAFRRSQAGRIGLTISAAATALVSLLAILSVVPVITLLMAGATVVLLFTGGANDWYARRDAPPPGSGGGGGHAWPAHPGQSPTPGQPPYSQQPPYAQPPYAQPPKEKVKPW